MSSSSANPPSNEPANEPVPALRLTAEDFDAFSPGRAGDAAFGPARLALRGRMMGWARGVVTRLRELDVVMDIAASDDSVSGGGARSQRIHFWRDEAARAELDEVLAHGPLNAHDVHDGRPAAFPERYVVLGLKLDEGSLDVSIELRPAAWVDLRNVRVRLSEPERALELTGALEALPEEFSLGLVSDAEPIQARIASSDVLRNLLDRCEAEKTALWLGWSIPRDVALSHVELLDDQLADALVALGHVYRLVAWAPDNDLLVLDREIGAAREEEARHEETERAEAEREARRDEERRPRPKPPEAWMENDKRGRESDAWSAAESSKGRPDGSFSPAPPRAAGAVGQTLLSVSGRGRGGVVRAFPKITRPIIRRIPLVTEVDPTAPIDRGTKVRVLAGPFADKVAVVQDLDGKGSARIMLGLLAMWLPISDLVGSAEGRDRPSLGSSHRKPNPTR